MKQPSPAKQKKVTVENLVGLGAERLAEILTDLAATRADLKRRLRMELAAAQGPEQLAPEIDKRLSSFETSRGKITWRQRPAFLRDFDALRKLITERLAPLDVSAAAERLWRFMETARPIGARYRAKGGELDAAFERAAGDLGRLLAGMAPGPAAAALVESLGRNPSGWAAWLPALLAQVLEGFAGEVLRFMGEQPGGRPGWVTLIRQAADAAGDVDAYAATWGAETLATPAVAAAMGQRYLKAGRVQEAGAVLQRAAPTPNWRGKAPAPDEDWESAWIDYLEQAGQGEQAQEARWASFERTLSVERARAFISRLDDFDDVEAEERAFRLAASQADFAAGLGFLMAWPALGEAGRMIEARPDDIEVAPEAAELWAAKLRQRYPKAAHLLLRRAAAAAFRRRDFKTCDRLTAEADTIEL